MRKTSFLVLCLFAMLILSGMAFAQTNDMQCRETCCNENGGQWTSGYNGVCSWPGMTQSDEVASVTSAYSNCIDKCAPPSVCTISFILPAFVGMIFLLNKRNDVGLTKKTWK